MNESNQSVWQVRLLAKIFAAPVILSLFFALAPMWKNSVYTGNIIGNLEKNPDITATQKKSFRTEFQEMNLEQVCSEVDDTPSEFAVQLAANGYCDGFTHLHWGLWFSLLSLGLMALNLILSYALSRQAERSAAHLLANYKLAWRMNLASVFMQLLLLAPLLAYALFEVTALALNRYFPQLILMLLFAAGYAIYQCARSLYEKVPMEFGEFFARQIQRTEAPVLWSDIETVAKNLGAPTPENIVVGMSENFYVTELGVQTSQGVVQGRTLYLSYFLMKYLSPQEIMSIVAHELGHFHGEDTKNTRELYPLIYRVNQSLWILAATGWAAIIVRQMLMQFAIGFKWPEQKISRERELSADRFGARYIDHRQMAQALVKVNALSQAYQLSLGKEITDEVDLIQFYDKEVAGDMEFWNELSQFKTPHPLDSHPALADRLKNLGIDPKPETLQELARFSPEASAYSAWFGSNEQIFEEMRGSWIETMINSSVQYLDASTAEGRQELIERFPYVRWYAKKRRFWKSFILFATFGAFLLIVAVVIPHVIAKIIFATFGLLTVYITYFFYRNHYYGVIELDHEGVFYSGFREKILFSSVASLDTNRISGTDYLVFYFKETRPRIMKFNLIRQPYKAEQIPISDFEISSEQIVAQVSSYFHRTV